MNELLKRINDFTPLILRIGMSIVFLYFGISQVISPQFFVGWLPKEVSLLPLTPTTIVILNGGFEIFFGVLLIIGLWRRISALLLGLHLLGITFTIGFTEIGIRDFGLAIATITISLIIYDKFSLDNLISNSSSATNKSYEKNNENNN